MSQKQQRIIEDNRTEHPFRHERARTVKVFVAVALIVLGLLVAAYFVGRPTLSKWRYGRDLENAARYEKEGDWRSAMLTLEQLSRLHPAKLEVRQRLAAFYERAGQREALNVWQEALALAPDQPEVKIGLARTAIRFGDLPTARKILTGFAPTDSLRAEFHRLSAALALLDRDPVAQETHLTALRELAPDDGRVRLNLAVLRLSGSEPHKAAEARNGLLELARGDRVRIRAIVELLNDVARRWPRPSPARSDALQQLAETLAPARGPLLELPSQVDHIDRLLAYAMMQPAPTAEDAVALANWMSSNEHTQAALEWLDSLPEALRQSAIVKTAVAEFVVRAKDWPRLQTLLREGAWGAVPAEAVEQAFRAHRQSDGSSRSGVSQAWSAALQATRGSPPALRMLLRLSELWQWPVERRQTLLAIARALPHETWAWRQLLADALSRNDSDQVWQIYQDWRRALPGEALVRVEAAIMGFLLGRRPVPDTTETAGYTGPTVRAGGTVAHALALWRAGRAGEAAAALDGLPGAEFDEPRYGLARAIVLSAAGRARESEEQIKRLDGAVFLPEEKELLVASRARNRASSR
jgi:thioredoxin-like negative regulator of GroEL